MRKKANRPASAKTPGPARYADQALQLATRRAPPTGGHDVSPNPHMAQRADGSRDGYSPAAIHNLRRIDVEHAVQRYLHLYDFTPIGYVSFDGPGRIAEINLTAAKLFRLPRERLIGMPFAVLVFREDAILFLHHLMRCRSLESRVETELRLKSAKDEIIFANLSSAPISSSMREGATLYQTAIVDLTQRKQAEDAVRESEERLRALVEQAIVGMVRCDLEGRLTFANEKFCRMLGYDPSELIGKTIADITHPDDIAQNMRLFRRLAANGKPFEVEKRYICKDGSALWTHVSASPMRDAAGKTQSATAVVVDITARRKAEAALRRSKQLLEKLVKQRTKALHTANIELENEIKRRKGLEGEILEISDREQERLGQELHDGICQHLTAVAFMARSVALRLKNHRVIQVDDLHKIAQLVNDAAADTRDLSRALHRVNVEAAGLENALQDLVDREIWRTPCRLEVKRPIHLKNNIAACHLYRIAREAVINANKHAQAREIVVKLGHWQNGIVLSVTDNGVGIHKNDNHSQGLGFHIMNYRAQAAGGRLEIESPRGGGTRVACYLPAPKLKRALSKGRVERDCSDAPAARAHDPQGRGYNRHETGALD